MILQIIFSFLVSLNALVATEPSDTINTKYFNLYEMNRRNPIEAALYVCRFAEGVIKLASRIDVTSKESCELRKLEEMLAKIESLEYTEDETVEIGNIFREYKAQILSGCMIPQASKTACEELKKVFDLAKKKDKRDFLSNNIDANSFTRYPALLTKSLMHGVAYTLDSICNIPSTILRLILNRDGNTNRFSFFENMLQDACISKKDMERIHIQSVARAFHELPSILAFNLLYGTCMPNLYRNMLAGILASIFVICLYNNAIYPLLVNLKDSCNCSEDTFEVLQVLGLFFWCSL